VNQVDRSSATALETAARIVTVSPNSKPGVGYAMLYGHREHVGGRAATSREKAIGRITPAYPSASGHELHATARAAGLGRLRLRRQPQTRQFAAAVCPGDIEHMYAEYRTGCRRARSNHQALCNTT
jgi:hypothetical protein